MKTDRNKNTTKVRETNTRIYERFTSRPVNALIQVMYIQIYKKRDLYKKTTG